MKPKEPIQFRKARRIFQRHGGMLRTGEAIRAGIHPRTLYAMRDRGLIQAISRGLYRLADLPPLGNPDLVAVARRAPNGVLCLVSALAFHEITTQVPHEVHLALARGARSPRIQHPPIRVFWFADKAFREGQELHDLEGVPVRVYGPEKTVADCFKYRHKIGLDTAIEALKFYLRRKPGKVTDLMRFARICRVGTIVRHYLEALL